MFLMRYLPLMVGIISCLIAKGHTAPADVNSTGTWTSWSGWRDCSATCGDGEKIRNRECNNTAHDGLECEGRSIETMVCSIRQCPAWHDWADCSTTCGNGERQRSRECNNPAPAHGDDGQDCVGDSGETSLCSIRPCPINGMWSPWSDWADCSATCGDGETQRSRECNNPAPAHDGQDCVGDSSETFLCFIRPCPINGMWSQWNGWTDCSATCGNGQNLRSRECTNPAPAHDGLDCEGSDFDFSVCSENPCPINGMWSPWSDWADCSATCGDGETQRSRECNNPAPAHDGQDCVGDSSETSLCFIRPCPINGMWSAWSGWTGCSATCGNGGKLRSRECSNPAPAHDGLDCVGESRETMSCIIKPCPVHGGWSHWTSWIAECSATVCNEAGLQLRRRSCTNPKPNHGGRHCRGQYYGSRECINTDACPVNGGWGEWGDFGACSATCGRTFRQKTRECDNPSPKNGGKWCQGTGPSGGALAEFCTGLPPCPTTTNGCDDEDEDCEGSGSGATPTPSTHPCSYFESSYDYTQCIDGHLFPPTPEPDVPGNEDTSPEDEGEDPNPFEYSLSSDQDENGNNEVPEEEEKPVDQGQGPANNPLDYSYSLGENPKGTTKNPDEGEYSFFSD